MLREARPDESDALVRLGVATDLFTEDEADVLPRDTLARLHENRLGPGHHARVW